MAKSKLMSLFEAVSLVRRGDCLGIGGMTLYRKPMAFVREVARRRIRDLTVIGFTSGFEAEVLALAGSLSVLRTCYFGLEFLGLSPVLRKSVERGDVKIVDETECSLVLGLQASLMRVPYLPARDCAIGTDYFGTRHDWRREPCPITGDVLTWMPQLAPRVAVIHVSMADEYGNAWLGGQHCIDAQLAMAADVTIVTSERIATTREIRNAQGSAGLVSFMVDGVVEVPGGAHPTSCYPDYSLDVVHLAEYLSSDLASGQAYLTRYVDEPSGCSQYLSAALEGGNEFA